MKKALKNSLLLLTLIVLVGCASSDDSDCMKTITIPQYYFVNNQSYSYDITQEVPCDFPEPTVAELIEAPTLENFSYEIIKFEFTPDTGNNTTRLEFEIKLNNPNDYAVSGVPILTLNTDGLETTSSFSNNASVPCLEIAANSHCVLTFNQENSLDLGLIDSIELVNVGYYLIN
ncbi:hypothetical protein [uncultured Algibacter sp.]|uniref:hypothetical protein n=1 Tax=uncultured Algibacter sp. TaxID=298659 RepID=UPI0026030B8D|nr:hypothetical protein [uncultured Algibacter sp.]